MEFTLMTLRLGGMIYVVFSRVWQYIWLIGLYKGQGVSMIIISHNGAIWDIKPIKIIFAPTFEPNVKFSYSAWPYCNPWGMTCWSFWWFLASGIASSWWISIIRRITKSLSWCMPRRYRLFCWILDPTYFEAWKSKDQHVSSTNI
jgi:hypothetical protein